MTAVLTANPNSGVPGSDVTLTGSGFSSGESVNLYANSTGSDFLYTATADAGGSFLVSVACGSVASTVETCCSLSICAFTRAFTSSLQRPTLAVTIPPK